MSPLLWTERNIVLPESDHEFGGACVFSVIPAEVGTDP